MIARWLIIGFVLWLGITVGFRFAGQTFFTTGPGGVTWLFLILPVLMFAITYGALKLFKVDPTDRSEAASVFALPGLLIGIYQINSFGVMYPNLEADLSNEFAALMFACYAAVIVAGLLSSHVRTSPEGS
jgi:Family of unknown function (DUF5367)